MPHWRGNPPPGRDGYWEEGGVVAISGVLLPWLVLCWHGRLCLCRNSVLCFKIQYHLIICDFFFFGGGGCHASLKQLKTSLAFVCVCYFVSFWFLAISVSNFVTTPPRVCLKTTVNFCRWYCTTALFMVIFLCDHLSLPYLATSNSSRKNLQNLTTRFAREVTNW